MNLIAGSIPGMVKHLIQGEVEILPVTNPAMPETVDIFPPYQLHFYFFFNFYYNNLPAILTLRG